MKRTMSIFLITILLGTFLIAVNPVSAGTIHVYPGDNIVAIVGAAASGDTIYVHAGTYNITDQIIITKEHVTIIGDSPFNTIIESQNNHCISSGQSYITIKNITVRYAMGDGIYSEGDYATIENCIAHSNNYHGIHVDDYSTIKNCLMYYNGSDGINVDDDCEIINCTSVYNGSDGIELEDDCNLYNCIFANNDDDGFEVDSEGIYVYNTNSWGNGDKDWSYGTSDDVYLINCISKDPQFVPERLGNFYLGYSSPCADSGYGSSKALGLYNGFTTRTDGRWDTGTVDMGFHYVSSNGSPESLPMAKIMEIVKDNQEE